MSGILSPFCFQKVASGTKFALLDSERRRYAAGTFTVTCKILRQVIGKDLVVWRVSGRITGEDVNTLRALLEQESGPPTLDFKDVRLVDAEAVRLLAVLESNGARLNNCPLYIREWIRREKTPNG